ncbi:family 20 glycosylhydrolase [Vibrio sp. SS-MA-C1-2]|uniref:family 20 glycosylhydrolase n=1 Tax=Vibrio sp. SS-MA-C1-2 TaxID=2908646 RepID=UPI001F2BFD10|nr:family 20 glycosylhydrolase [Vibrio sp. SS-MA-C1-2]UJF17932.1 family 20 glycosylhydrolase [Vibrio sp. SS-MA-C1-2]
MLKFPFNDLKLAQESYQLVGNVRWPATGELVAATSIKGSEIPTPNGGYPVSLTKKEQKLILGGEAAIWAENYDDSTLDNRIWPRSYVVAERLWSSEELTDEASMYQRLQTMDRWSTISVGLQQKTSIEKQLLRLANGHDVAPLRQLANYAEPAQYYARNWIKFNQTEPKGELYSQSERLNRFADALPVESFKVLDMEKLATQTTDRAAMTNLLAHYNQVLDSAKLSKMIFADNIASVDSQEIAQKHVDVAYAAKQLLEQLLETGSVSSTQIDVTRDVLAKSAAVYDEVVVAIARPTEILVNTLSR